MVIPTSRVPPLPPAGTATAYAPPAAGGAAGPTEQVRGRRSAPFGPFLGPFLAGLLGAAAFVAVCGVRTLDPNDLGWLTRGDPAQYLLGWSFFRTSLWALPPGANPAYGLEIASSIFFTDSIPLFAFLLKALRPLVEVQQYFGWWLLLCFVLQGVAGWLLMGIAVRNDTARLLGAALLCFAPPFLWRLHGHYSLMGHWLVLLALWLAAAPPNPRRWPFAWGGLLCAAALVHAYLLAMAAVLWASDLARRGLAASAAAASPPAGGGGPPSPASRQRRWSCRRPWCCACGRPASSWSGAAFRRADSASTR